MRACPRPCPVVCPVPVSRVWSEGELTVRTAVIIGAGGIGAECALHLTERGYERIYLLSTRSTDTADRVRDRIRERGFASESVTCDVTDWSSIGRAAAEVDGPVHAMVYTAGSRISVDLGSLTQDTWVRAMNVYAGGFVGAVLAFREKFEVGAAVVALSGLSARTVVADQLLPMGTAKAAMERSISFLSHHLAPRRVRINGICCGLVETPGIRQMLTPEVIEKRREEEARRTIAGRVAQPIDIARLVGVLCSDDTGWLYGQVLFADGGAALV